ncbi:MAG: cobalt ECF transporter T component CbiQ [Verrucomicrobiae bacterium]|nr:cobalt ECF transporter T component CbiQ [Verrucomicrobiae bacterium]
MVRLDFFDYHSRSDSPVHRAPAAVKLAVAVGLVLATVACPLTQPTGFAAVGAVLIAIAAMSRIPTGFLVKRLLWLEPFAAGVALLTLFQPQGGRVFLTILLKANLCLLTMILLSNTTPFADVLRVFKRLRVPSLMVTTLALMYRYLFVLVEETRRMSRARASRTFLRRRGLVWRSLASVIGQLFIRSTERAERIYAAMCARGWR